MLAHTCLERALIFHQLFFVAIYTDLLTCRWPHRSWGEVEVSAQCRTNEHKKRNPTNSGKGGGVWHQIVHTFANCRFNSNQRVTFWSPARNRFVTDHGEWPRPGVHLIRLVLAAWVGVRPGGVWCVWRWAIDCCPGKNLIQNFYVQEKKNSITKLSQNLEESLLNSLTRKSIKFIIKLLTNKLFTQVCFSDNLHIISFFFSEPFWKIEILHTS